jgi:hypothetical protein
LVGLPESPIEKGPFQILLSEHPEAYEDVEVVGSGYLEGTFG